MPNHFGFADDDDDDVSSPATPSHHGFGGSGFGTTGTRGSLFRFDDHPSTTPAGRPPSTAGPSTAGSFTPAGAPSASYLGSSMMRGVAGTATSEASPSSSSTARKIFSGGAPSHSTGRGSGTNSPLGRSIQGSSGAHGRLGAASRNLKPKGVRMPSRLSQMMVDDEEEEEEEEEDGKGDDEDADDEDAEGEDDDDYRPPRKTASEEDEDEDEEEEGDEDEEEGSEEEDGNKSDENGADPWLNLAQTAAAAERAPWMSADDGEPGDDTDLLMFATPAVDDRVRREAEDIFRASVARSGGGSVAGGSRAGTYRRQPREFRYAAIAKDMYRQMGYAAVTEAPELVRQTEVEISHLYAEGIGREDDPDRLDQALADGSAQLVGLWRAYVDSLPSSLPQAGQKHHEQQRQGDDDDDNDEEPLGNIGPGPHASAFENAAYVATLALQVHHTRSMSFDAKRNSVSSQVEPLPATLFRWLNDYHNPDPDQEQDVLRAASLRAGGWDAVRRAGIPAYTGQALANVERAVRDTVAMLEMCPGRDGHWDVWSEKWTLFRLRARGALEQLRRFAEGRDADARWGGSRGVAGGGRIHDDSDMNDGDRSESNLGDSFRSYAAGGSGGGGGVGTSGGHSRQSMAGLARRAESQVPWDIYENINIVFDIVLGSRERILAISQDWCEALVGLFGWWDETKTGAGAGASSFRQSRAALSLQQQQQQQRLDPRFASTLEGYLDRLTRAFRATTDAGLEINSSRPLEVALACVFEDNPRGLVGLLRSWSLPVAVAVIEIASLGGWLPAQSSSTAVAAALASAMDDLDMEDLEVLGVDPADPDDTDGIKDNTLMQYAQALVNDDVLKVAPADKGGEPPRHDVEGGGGSDDDEAPASSSSSSPATMEGWELAIHVLGRMNSPERAEETVGELVRTMLKTLDVDAGGTLDKIWRLLNDLDMASYAEEAAEHYGDLLTNESYRFGEAVWYYAIAHRPAKLARRDLDAAELLGRMLSGYATLRQFYDLRDSAQYDYLPLARRRTAAAAALSAVIASADDSVRGGLYDGSRDTVVSEDFLLVLLGEALVFVETAIPMTSTTAPPANTFTTSSSQVTAPPVISAETVDVLLKAAEDLQALAGSRVYAACDEFFQVVRASAPGLQGSTPADLLQRSTSNLSSGGNSAASSYVLAGSSLLASQLHRSMVGGAAGGGGNAGSSSDNHNANGHPPADGTVHRGWDWRSGLTARTTGAEVLQRMRHGLSRALARLWVAEADGLVVAAAPSAMVAAQPMVKAGAGEAAAAAASSALRA
ncbi:vitamin h transporter 1 [Niveomyces insectorum RCEF 264]|uniref:Vitamin h transporter 1 n=1 Tax=Niveomyces insectorum RCEF 264 TaxID=1081102 RepID=A0A167S132_9HYPO|nr:vitamin h transporter 1 [Niveomyces insectorum RCEF 264]